MEPSKQTNIGPYQLLRSLGKGGMGEVFLAYDPLCERQVALKKIREDFIHNKEMQKRFLKEAKIASQLTHPSIIPIHAINQDEDAIYYTMPYVEGETLSQILRITREQEKRGEEQHPIGASIPTLTRIFLNVCQAIAYCHSRKILHRDLKPENIIVGKYGEVMILDWGIAEEMRASQKSSPDSPSKTPKKVPGTLAYMPPERALGEDASVLTDIYSLGVILYQLLTLRLPFLRTTLQEFRKYMAHEKWVDPFEKAPYRDIPAQLCDMAKKCLAFSKEERYQNAEALIADLENYIEGKPEWILSACLNIQNKTDWAFQENILLAKHIAITRNSDVMEWVGMMLSKSSFSGNTKIEATVYLGSTSQGLGFLFCIPENSPKRALEEGYCLWIGSSLNPGCKLIRYNVEVMHLPHLELVSGTKHKVRIEKVENNILFFLDGHLKFKYIGHLPMAGAKVGILARDAAFEIEELNVFAGSQHAQVNCLSVPDAFLANKDFSKALVEYRRIGNSFSGRTEGREALFRAGITLLEQSLLEKRKRERERLSLLALEEFGKLRSTPGAPLEYLGKSLVYKASKEIEEEVKCLELALRKYPKHPLLPILAEHIVFRLHETSYHNRFAAYHLALLSLRHLPSIFSNPDNQGLIDSLKKHCEPLTFIKPCPSDADLPTQNAEMALELAFWLAKPITLIEIFESFPKEPIASNVLFSLLKWRCTKPVREALSFLEKNVLEEITPVLYHSEKELEKALSSLISAFSISPHLFLRPLLHLMDAAIEERKIQWLLPRLPELLSTSPSKQDQLLLDVRLIKIFFLCKEWKKGEEILRSYPLEELCSENSPLYFLFGCSLFLKEGEKSAKKHFSSLSDHPFPLTTALFGHYLRGNLSLKKGWIIHALPWEKIELFRQISFFYDCIGDQKKASSFQKKARKEMQRVVRTIS